MIWDQFTFVVLVLLIATRAAFGQTCDFSKCTFCQGSTCYSCEDGYFPSGKYCYRCTYDSCKTCSDGNSCDMCRSGYWGPTCNKACSPGCDGFLCDINDGSCTCSLGNYGSQCFQTCSQNCVNNTCSTVDGSCQCRDGYYGERCENTCMTTCQACTDGSLCSVCPVGRHGPVCSLICNCNGGPCDIVTGQCGEQSTCPSQCTSCSDTGICTSCQTGLYGPQCTQSCPSGCNGGCDTDTGSCYGCVRGSYGTQCQQTCSTGCTDLGCHQNGTCYQCVYTNVYGLYCNSPCSSLCVNSTCDRWTGMCPLACHSRCELCDTNTGNCIKCKQSNNYGNDCQFYCKTECLNQSCNQTTGECFTCINGHWGPFCNTSCSSGCSSSGCDRTSGQCIECASQTLYGALCESCSDLCTDRQCDQNGNCASGCVTNHYGQRCQFVCSGNCITNSTGSACDTRGRCLYGCINDEYTGDDCSVTASATATTGSNVPVAVVGSILGLAVIILAVLLALQTWRIRKLQAQQPSNIYQGLDSNRQQRTYDSVNRDGLDNTDYYEDTDPSDVRVTVENPTHVYYNAVE